MARTRSRTTKVVIGEEPTGDVTVATTVQEAVHEDGQQPPSTFNGHLNKFLHSPTSLYVSPVKRTPTSITSPTKSALEKATATRTSTRKRTQKRTQQIATETYDGSISPPTSASSPRPQKKRKPSKYAPPEKYAHLSPLTDILAPNLICVFVGTNPGIKTATAGHAYAHPSNHFWKLLHSSGLTPDRRLKPEEDRTLPEKYQMGNTNIVTRPSRDAAELSKGEMVDGAGVLEEKFRVWKPESVCIVGKGIWEAIWRWKYGRNMRPGEFRYGWQDEKHNMGLLKKKNNGEDDGDDESEEEKEGLDGNGNVWKGSRVYVTTSTSGLAASLKPAEKEAIWKPFGEWVQKRRQERLQESSCKTEDVPPTEIVPSRNANAHNIPHQKEI